MKNIQKGFTLIELIVVLVIIGMISAFALPKYQDHIAKTQATEALQLIEPLKIELYENIHYNNKCVNNDSDKEIHEGKFARAVISNNDSYVVELTTNKNSNDFLPEAREDTGCRIYVKYKNGTNDKIRNKNLVLAYLYNGQLIALNDETNSIATKYIPDPIKKPNNDDEYIVNRKPFQINFEDLNSNDDLATN